MATEGSLDSNNPTLIGAQDISTNQNYVLNPSNINYLYYSYTADASGVIRVDTLLSTSLDPDRTVVTGIAYSILPIETLPDGGGDIINVSQGETLTFSIVAAQGDSLGNVFYEEVNLVIRISGISPVATVVTPWTTHDTVLSSISSRSNATPSNYWREDALISHSAVQQTGYVTNFNYTSSSLSEADQQCAWGIGRKFDSLNHPSKPVSGVWPNEGACPVLAPRYSTTGFTAGWSAMFFNTSSGRITPNGNYPLVSLRVSGLLSPSNFLPTPSSTSTNQVETRVSVQSMQIAPDELKNQNGYQDFWQPITWKMTSSKYADRAANSFGPHSSPGNATVPTLQSSGGPENIVTDYETSPYNGGIAAYEDVPLEGVNRAIEAEKEDPTMAGLAFLAVLPRQLQDAHPVLGSLASRWGQRLCIKITRVMEIRTTTLEYVIPTLYVQEVTESSPVYDVRMYPVYR